MWVHEIAVIRKGSDKTRKAVELTAVRRETDEGDAKKKFTGIEVSGTIHIEASIDDLTIILGEGYDVGHLVRLDELKFEDVPQPEEDA